MSFLHCQKAKAKRHALRFPCAIGRVGMFSCSSHRSLTCNHSNDVIRVLGVTGFHEPDLRVWECVGSGEWWGVRFSVSLGGKKCFCEPALPFSSEFVFRHVPSALWLFLTILPSNLSLTSFHIYTVLPLSHSPQIPLLKCWLWRNYSSIEHLCVTNKRDKWCMHIVEVSVYMSLKTKF